MLNFILLAQQSWEEKNTGSNIWDMAHILARDHNVLLVNPALDWSSLQGEGSRKRRERKTFLEQYNGQHLIELTRNLWLLNPRKLLGSFNWLPDSPLYDRLNRYNGLQLTGEIKAAVRQLDWSSYIVLNDNDIIRGFYIKEFLQPTLSIYYLRDNLLATPYWQRHGSRLEPQLMAKTDLIVSNSVYLTAQAARHNPRSVYIGQGCDLALFDPGKAGDEPAPMAGLPHPRIGYTGALTSLRLDADLIETVARRQPDWQVVLMGGVDESFPKERLQLLPNITFLDPVPMQQVPAYLASMDVLINPQILNEVTIGNYPRKIDEYLAMGKPVVAVKTDAMVLFGSHVYLAETADEFIMGITGALGNDQLSSAGERIAFALEHSWENSVGALMNAVDELLATPKPV